MSSSPRATSGTSPTVAPDASRRVRHQARDAATLMAFSAMTSVGIAGLFLVLTVLGRQV